MTRITKLIWMGSCVLVIIIALVILLRLRKQEATTSPSVTPLVQVEPTYAPSGQLASTFPTDLLLGAMPDITQSYSLPYNSQNQSTVEYTAQGSPDALFQDYLTYFQANHYGVITKQQTSSLDSLYASSMAADISVIIVPGRGQCSINTSFLKK